MSDDPQYSSGGDSGSNKRKYEDQSAPPPRRPTGFSAPIIAAPSDSSAASYNSVAPPADEIQLAKQRAQEIAARLFNNASAAGSAPPPEAKRPRFENGGGYDSGDHKGFSSGPPDLKSHGSSSIPVSYGFHGSSKKIDVPNGRVGVIIGKGGETIKYLQTQSGAKIQVTRDMDADLNSSTRIVELMGTPEQILKAEQLINDVLAGAETGGQGGGGGLRRVGGPVGGEQFVMKIPNNKVGLVIGKGGETIKSMQGRTGARIQVIPLHLPPGDPSSERTLQIDGTTEQIENAKQLVFEVISENRPRNPSMSGGYGQQGYQTRPPSWGPTGGSSMQQQQQQQQPGYGYNQPGAYSAPPSQYNSQGSYPGYSQQSAGGYAANWDQSTAPPPQQGGYDYYAQQQNPAGPGAPADTAAGYGYPASGYPQQGQGYTQDGYSGYQAQSGYAYGQQGYGAATGPTDPQATSYADSSQPPAGSAPTPPPAAATASAGQQGYGSSQPSPNPNPKPASYPSQQGYGVPPTSQAGGGYGPGYGAPPQGQKQPPNAQSYGQATQSPTTGGGGYGQQAGYPHSQAGGYGQPESGAHRGYGGPLGSQLGYGQAQPYGGYGSGGYAQPPPQYSADGAALPTSQAAKTPPQS